MKARSVVERGGGGLSLWAAGNETRKGTRTLFYRARRRGGGGENERFTYFLGLEGGGEESMPIALFVWLGGGGEESV